MNIRINSKNYVVPQLGFKHMTKMEDRSEERRGG